MSERIDIAIELAELEAERTGLLKIEADLHEGFMADSTPDEERDIVARELEKIMARLDEISNEVGCWEARLYVLNGRQSRCESLADKAYGRME